mgnify:CR=1 FL=1
MSKSPNPTVKASDTQNARPPGHWPKNFSITKATMPTASAISKTIGTIVFILIIVPVGIAALDVLGIPSITGPAKPMLEMVLSAVPLIIGASLVLGLGYVIARWVGSMIEEVLPGLGFDRSVEAIGIVPEGRSASGIVATISQVAIMLFMAVAATRLLARLVSSL